MWTNLTVKDDQAAQHFDIASDKDDKNASKDRTESDEASFATPRCRGNTAEGSGGVALDVGAARELQELLMQQLEQVQRALRCNIEIARRLGCDWDATATGRIPSPLQERSLHGTAAAAAASSSGASKKAVDDPSAEDFLANAIEEAKADQKRGSVWEGTEKIIVKEADVAGAPAAAGAAAAAGGDDSSSVTEEEADEKKRREKAKSRKSNFVVPVLNLCPSEDPLHSIKRGSLEVPLGRSISKGSGGDLSVALLDSESASHLPTPRQAARKSLFLDADVIKKFVETTLGTSEYNVEDLYEETGFPQAVARNSFFKNATLVVIFLNTVWIAIDTDYNDADIITEADAIFQIMENFFCAFFTFEITVRFLAFRRKCDAFQDGWFVFDSFLVLLMVWETWVVPILFSMMKHGSGHNPLQNSSIFRALRLFRLFRASRVLRLLRSFPELMILIQAMLAAMRSVFGTLSLLLLITYIFAILFTQLLHGTPEAKGCFETVPGSMNCLMMLGVFPDQQSRFESLLDGSWVYYMTLLVYVSIAVLTVMNLLIGILCEVVGEVARVEKESMTVGDLKHKLLEVMTMIDSDGNNLVSAAEFEKLLTNEQACAILNDFGVDIYGLVDHSDFIFDEHSSLDFSDFVETVLKFRVDNTATVKDVVHIRKTISREILQLEKRLKNNMRK